MWPRPAISTILALGKDSPINLTKALGDIGDLVPVIRSIGISISAKSDSVVESLKEASQSFLTASMAFASFRRWVSLDLIHAPDPVQ